MKKTIYLLLTFPLLFASCVNEDMPVSDETVQVNFLAELPPMMGTRASALSVDKVYCAVFEDGEEIRNLREAVDIIDGQAIIYSPRLIKGRTYDVVFWASKDGSYDINDMTAIKRAAGSSGIEADYDAFTATTSLTVSGNTSEGITLKRPIAQLNMGVTQADWDGVANPSTFNMTPTRINLTINGVKDTFNALEGIATGNVSDITYELAVDGSEFTCQSSTYKSIAMCYILAESEKQNISLSYSIYDQDDDPIREDAIIFHIPLQRNYTTNLVGGLLTGTITYTISFEDEFQTDEDHNKVIE